MTQRQTYPRPEYPRPQFVRDDWLCLNGLWQFEIDAGDSGKARGLIERPLQDAINVPFCPESTLSGINHVDFMRVVWYRREVDVPAEWKGRRVLLHFGAVDYDATVWCDGREIRRHRGGHSPFVCDLGDVGGQTVIIVVRARDLHDRPYARGKQVDAYANFGCSYTRTTGIWQTVWMEPLPTPSLGRPRVTPDVGNGAFHIIQPLEVPHMGLPRDLSYRVTLRDEQGEVVAASSRVSDLSPMVTLPIPADRLRLWSLDDPHLYDLTFELFSGETLHDRATGYAGLRSVTIEGKAVKLNGKTVFQRLVLDQGYYADGILTAPTDAHLARDIELAKAAGFNGARLHQKVFEERFLYHADRLGYLCWGEFADWGCGRKGGAWEPEPTGSYITQWLECLARDFNHPSLIGWCPINELNERPSDEISNYDDVLRGMFLATKAFDPTRPVLDASGWTHRIIESDIYDSHDYEQDHVTFKANHVGLAVGRPRVNEPGGHAGSIAYGGQPYFVSEFGGVWWNAAKAAADVDGTNQSESWGYGNRPQDEEEVLRRIETLCGVLLDDPNMFGYCYTQLTDVFQEENGIYAFDRSSKFDEDRMRRIRAAQQREAAIEADTN